MNIAVLGAGAWGTAMAISLARHPVVPAAARQATLWGRDAAWCATLQADRQNERYLPGHPFPPALRVMADLDAALVQADMVLVATPLAGLRPTVRQLHALRPGLPFLWLCKGLEAGSGLLPHQVVADETGGAAALHGALTGPSFAEEVARGLPTAITLASRDAGFARHMAQQLSGPRLRIYANDDLPGAEVGGAVKNVLAIASGICDGLGLGHNARAALLTRGLAEVVRFGLALGARRETLMGLAGMGDLILTCTGDLSRNRRVGLALAQGRSLPEIVAALGHVAEGVPTAREVARRAEVLGVDMPIVRAVCGVLDGRLSAADAVDQLMLRDPRDE